MEKKENENKSQIVTVEKCVPETAAYNELVINEARYKGIVEDQTELIFRFSKTGKITFANNAFCRYFSKSKVDLIDHTFIPLIPKEDFERRERLIASIEFLDPVKTIDYRVLTPSGEIKWQQWVYRGIFDEKGEFVEYQAVGRDITEKKVAEEKTEIYLEALEKKTLELEKSKLELEVTNKKYMATIDELKKKEEQLERSEKLAIIGEFAGGITHEIKNPLGAIITNVQLMKDDIDEIRVKYDEEKVNDIENSREVIEIAAKQAKDIITSLLAYTRLEETRFKKFDLNNVVNTTVLLMKKELWAVGISLVTEMTDKVMIMGKSGELTQVLLNIVLNARDAISEKNAGENKYIKIKTEKKDGEIYLTVEDNGIGIEDEAKHRIFEPFYTTKEHGTGLGMSISLTILRKHNAKIDIESKKREGAKFIIKFEEAV